MFADTEPARAILRTCLGNVYLLFTRCLGPGVDPTTDHKGWGVPMSGATILVVDDEPQIRRTLRTTLANVGYMVVEARSGEQALESLREEQPELVLMDVNMPGLGGVQACREMREHSDVAIIMLTVRDTEWDKIQALDAGADDYVVKPFSMDELMSRIRAALRRTSSAEPLPSFVSKEL